MKVNELRIGNVVQFKSPLSNEWTLDKVHSEYFLHNSLLNVKGVPITEQWLFNFGFVKTREKKVDIHFDLVFAEDCIFRLIYHFAFGRKNFDDTDGFTAYLQIVGKVTSLITTTVREVHKLQNLYFALTDKELELKQQHEQN